MNITNLKIGTRLGVAFGIILLMLVLVAVLGISRMAALQSSIQTITNGNNVESSMAIAMRSSVADRMIALRNIVLPSDASELDAQVARVQKQGQIYADADTTLRSTFATFGLLDDERSILDDLKVQNEAAQPLINQVIAFGRAGKTAEAVAILSGALRSVQFKWYGDLIALEAREKKQSDAATAADAAAYQFARNLMLALSVAAVLLGCLIAWAITRSIAMPIRLAVKIAETVAAGDLTSEIKVVSTDETGMLLGALKVMNDSLRKIVGQVRTGTDTMATASQDIATGNLDLSSRTEEQASSLEETASSMEELTSTVRQNSENARQANKLAVTASEIATRGGHVVSEVVGTMGAINESSKKIADIISVIDSIAFQTNILALNAAVEAARAGEQGRGFAVVATEVRNLAQRSATAAKEIKILIGDSVEKVEAGARLVDQAGATMGEVVESVRRVSDIIGEITAAGEEQVLGIEQVNQAITQMDATTQQNAALVEQSAAAAESLQGQAAILTQVVSLFILDQQGAFAMLPSTNTKPAGISSLSKTKPALKPALKLTAKRAVKPAPPARRITSPTQVSAKAPATHTKLKTTLAVAEGEWEEF